MTTRRRPRTLLVGALAAALLAGAAATPAAAGEPSPAVGDALARVPRPARVPAAGVSAPAALPAVPEPTRVIVKYRDTVAARSVGRALRASGLREGTTVRTTRARLVEVSAGSAESVAARLEGDPDVEYAVPDVWLRPSAPNDPSWTALWGLQNTGQRVGRQTGRADVDIDAPQAWSVGGTRRSVVVGVIDTGIDIDHPELSAAVWTNPAEIAGNGVDDDNDGHVDDVHGWDFLNGDATVYDANDVDEHGTHVAGTIAAARNNHLGVAGVASGVSVMPLKVLGPFGGWTSDVIEALDYAAAHGVKIVNMSLGISAADDPDAANPALRDAISSSGLLVVAAAGNEGRNNDDSTVASYPASFTLPNIISVAAVDNRGALADFSNYGRRSVDVGAPGMSVLSTVPRLRESVAATESTVAGAAGGPSGQTVLWGFGLEDVADGYRISLLNASLRRLGATADTPILLVQDDEKDLARYFYGFRDAGRFYRAALHNYRNVTVRTVGSGRNGPSAAEMRGKLVVWETGDGFGLRISASGFPAFGRTLTGTDVTQLRTFVGAGGRLLLAGADAVYGNELSSFVTRTLKVAPVTEDHSRKRLLGRGPWGTTGYQLISDASPMRDVLVPLAGADALLAYPAVPGYDRAYATFEGTSMAAPHVSGVAALVLSRHPSYSTDQLRAHVLAGPTPLASLSSRTVTGGLVSASYAIGLHRPSAPTRVGARAGNRAAGVTFRAPASDGGLRVLRYVVTARPGGRQVRVTAPATTAVVSGLSNGTRYSFSVAAENALGRGRAAITTTVTPHA